MAWAQIALFMSQISLWTGVKIGVALLVLAILDYGFQRWKYERDLRMTPQEIREEMKNLEGNPQMIARRRQVQRQLAMHRLSDAVPKADVVITNPTELAVAIQYVPESMAAPIVVAKGAGADRRADSPTGLGTRHSHRGEEAAGPGPLPARRDRPPDPARTSTPRWPRCWPTSISSKGRRFPRGAEETAGVRMTASERRDR